MMAPAIVIRSFFISSVIWLVLADTRAARRRAADSNGWLERKKPK